MRTVNDVNDGTLYKLFVDLKQPYEHKERIDGLINDGKFKEAFSMFDKRVRQLAYFELFHRIPDDQKFDIFVDNLGCPGMKKVFNSDEIREIISYNKYSGKYRASINKLIEVHGTSTFYKVYQPDFGVHFPLCDNFIWNLLREKVVMDSNRMRTSGVRRSDILHYEEDIIYALPEDTIMILKRESRWMEDKDCGVSGN